MPPEIAPRAAAPRLLALSLPDLPLQRILRSRGGEGPLAVAWEGRVAHCTEAARAAGVRPGDGLAEARAACAALEVASLDPAADRAALRALAEAMLTLAPAVEPVPPDALLLDGGAARLLGTGEGDRDGEGRLAERARALAAEMGYRARAAVASGRGPALALARHGPGPVLVVAPGDTARALAPLPISALDLGPAVEERLRAVGIEDVGALGRLPPEALAHRFGVAGASAARLARGEDPAPLAPYVPETLPEESFELEAPAESAESLLLVLKRLADRAAARLSGRGLGATRIKLTLKLDPRGEERLLLPLARPTASARSWMLVLKERLMELRLPAAVAGLRLMAAEVAPVPAEQLAIGDRPAAALALEAILSRLAARLGEDALFAAVPSDRHRPEAAYRPVPFPRPRGAGRAAPPGEQVRPTRLLAPPRAAVAEGEGGRITALRIGGRAWPVEALVGPERLRGEWWSEPFDRDYYRVRLVGLGDCWIYRDGADGRLYLHGLFD